jgi:prolycopene isomerase
MGTGTPAVTVSGISAANAVLRAEGKETFVYKPGMKSYVNLIEPPFYGLNGSEAPGNAPENAAPGSSASLASSTSLASLASRCYYCEDPTCMSGISLDIRGINRRLASGNIAGAAKLLKIKPAAGTGDLAKMLKKAEKHCVLNDSDSAPVEISKIISLLSKITS